MSFAEFTSRTRAVADEAKALLDSIADDGEVILTPGDGRVAAISGALEVMAMQQRLLLAYVEKVNTAGAVLTAPLGGEAE